MNAERNIWHGNFHLKKGPLPAVCSVNPFYRCKEELCSHSHHSSSSRQLHELIADWGLIVPPQSSLTMKTGTVGLPALLVSAVLPTGHIQEASTRHVHSAFEIITTVHSACKQETKSLPSQHLINLLLDKKTYLLTL